MSARALVELGRIELTLALLVRQMPSPDDYNSNTGVTRPGGGLHIPTGLVPVALSRAPVVVPPGVEPGSSVYKTEPQNRQDGTGTVCPAVESNHVSPSSRALIQQLQGRSSRECVHR